MSGCGHWHDGMAWHDVRLWPLDLHAGAVWTDKGEVEVGVQIRGREVETGAKLG